MYNALVTEVKLLMQEIVHIIRKTDKFRIEQKGENDFVTEVDMVVSDILCERLPKLIEGSMVISEEGYKGKPEQKYCWIIDPIDGTNNFIYGLPACAISVGLLEDKKPVLGVIYNFNTEEIFWAAKGYGSYCNGRKIHVCNDSAIEKTLILAESNPYCNRKENQFHKIMDDIFCDCIDYRIIGSAALDCCYVACGRSGVFLAQNIKSWDYAAGAAILEEAGGRFTKWTGEDMGYDGGSTFLASNGLLHEELLKRLKKYA